MNDEMTGMILGGFIPAVLLGVFAIFQKLSVRTGAKPGMYLLFVAAGVAIIGAGFLVFGSRSGFSWQAAGASMATGIIWAVAVGLIAVAQGTYGARVARLVPLFNMNTLIAVVLGFLVFAEWRGVHVPRLTVGAILIIVGGTLVATA